MKKSQKRIRGASAHFDYDAPIYYVVFFYALLAVWTAVSAIFLGAKALHIGWPLGQLSMIAFVLAYTWYFSLGIAYRIRVGRDGFIELMSVRRRISISTESIEMVEGPRFALIPYCFVRFRLEREKAYLFCRITDKALHRVFFTIRRTKREIKFKGLPKDLHLV